MRRLEVSDQMMRLWSSLIRGRFWSFIMRMRWQVFLMRDLIVVWWCRVMGQ